MDFTLYTSRLETLESIFSGTEDPGLRVATFLSSAGDAGWLNPTIDWDSDERQELLHGLLLRELGRDLHLGGEPTPAGEHQGIVGVLAQDDGVIPDLQTVGSGVRVGECIVLTARHVVDGWDPTGIYFTGTAQAASAGIRTVVSSDQADVAAMVFDQLPGDSEIVPIAKTCEVTANAVYRSIGFGYCPSCRSAGPIKNHLDGMVIYTLDCSGEGEAERFNCRPGRDLVAGSVKRIDDYERLGMAYFGDSGGGLLVLTEDAWKLAGIVAGDDFDPDLKAARYTRIDAIQDELNEKLQARGLPTF